MSKQSHLNPNHGMYLYNLAIALFGRFEWVGSIDDLDQAIIKNEEAVKATPDQHPNRAGRLNSLGIALQKRFERTGVVEDLDQAISANELAVGATPKNHIYHASYLGMPSGCNLNGQDQ